MSAHMHYIKNAVLKSSTEIKRDLDECNAEKGENLDPITVDLRELTINFDHTPTVVRRVYLETLDSSSLTSVGWVVNEHMGFCMSCLKTFNLFNRRHHCRACGLLICGECSPSSALLKDFEDIGPQKVCGKCNPNMAKIVQLDNNMAWGRSVNAPPEILVDPNPIADVSGDLDAAFAIAQKEAAIAAMRMEEDHEKIAESAAALAALPKTIKLVPFPGFVIKTRRVVMDDNKVFINVFHHTSLPDETLILTYTPYSPKETNTGSTSPVSVAPDGTVTLPSVGERMTPIIYIGAKSSTEDKDGYASLLYNVLVSSSYFERRTVRNQELHITHPTSVNKIIQVVNQHFNDTLCEDNFVLPKVKSRYHGPPITRAIPFSKTEFTVAHHDAKYLYCTGFTPRDGGEGDDSSSIGGGGGRVVTTAQLQAAAVRASAADKMRRRSSGRGVSFGNARASPGNNEDAESMISDMTLNSILTENQQGFARENRRFSLYSSKKVEGTTVLTEEMLRINARKTMTSIYSDSIIESSITDPAVLLGYQIVMPYNKEIQAQFEKGSQVPFIDRSYIYVIIDMVKNNLRKTEYKVSNFTVGDSWVRLKRGRGKSGIEFRVLRKVYFPPEKEICKPTPPTPAAPENSE